MSIQSGTSPGAIISAGETPAGAPVTSVFGRIGAVVAVPGDYGSDDITNESGVAGATVSDALDQLDADIANLDSSDIANVSTVVGATVTDALNTLDADITALTSDDIANASTVPGATVSDALETAYVRATNVDGSTYHIYVAAGGSDLNNGLTPGTAIQTMARLYAIFPLNCFGSVAIHFDAASRDITNFTLPQRSALGRGCHVYFLGDGAGQGAQDGFTVVASGVAGAATTDLLIDFVSASTNLYAGLTIEWSAGAANAGQRTLVQRNTTTQIFTTCRWRVAPVVGDPFRILRPSAVFTYTDTCTFAANIGGDQINSCLFLENITFSDITSATTNSSPTRHVRMPRCTVVAYGVHCLIGSMMVSDGYIHSGWLSTNSNAVEAIPGMLTPWGTTTVSSFVQTAFPVGDIGISDISNWNGWGIGAPFLANTQRTPLLFDKTTVIGTIASADFIVVNAGSAFIAVGGSIIANGATNGGKLSLEFGGFGYIQSQSVSRRSPTSSKTSPGNPYRIECVSIGIDVRAGATLVMVELSLTATAAGNAINQIGGVISCPLTSFGTTIGISLTCSGGNRGWSIQDGGLAHVTTSAAAPVVISGAAIEAVRNSSMIGFNNLSCTGITLSGNSFFTNTQGVVTVISCTSLTITLTSTFNIQGNGGATSSVTITGTSSVRNLFVTDMSTMQISDCAFVLTGFAQLNVRAAFEINGAIGTSSITSTSVSGALIVGTDCFWNAQGINTGTFVVTQSVAAASAIRVTGRLSAVAAFSCTGTTFGINNANGGQVYVAGVPTYIAGTTASFLDEVALGNAFAAAQLATADQWVARGTHPGGVYSAAIIPTGASFVQRTS